MSSLKNEDVKLERGGCMSVAHSTEADSDQQTFQNVTNFWPMISRNNMLSCCAIYISYMWNKQVMKGNYRLGQNKLYFLWWTYVLLVPYGLIFHFISLINQSSIVRYKFSMTQYYSACYSASYSRGFGITEGLLREEAVGSWPLNLYESEKSGIEDSQPFPPMMVLIWW